MVQGIPVYFCYYLLGVHIGLICEENADDRDAHLNTNAVGSFVKVGTALLLQFYAV